MRLAPTLLAILALASVGIAQMGILGTAHDFSDLDWNPQRPQDVCGVCHIPHKETKNASTDNRLLWGLELSKQTNYTLYRSRSLVGTIGQPDGSTKLCIGCHDGSVALEHIRSDAPTGNSLITQMTKTIGRRGRFSSGDLSNSHPVSIVYVAGGATNLRQTSSPFGIGIIQDYLEESPPASGIFKVQCVTCHDVHNRDVQAGADHLLRIKNDMQGNPSALCLACHDK